MTKTDLRCVGHRPTVRAIAEKPAPAPPLDELERLALGGDPEAPLPPDAVPWHPAGGADGLLPDWYMPAPAGGQLRGWRRTVAWVLIGAALAVVASGLCNTYGELVVA